MAWRKFVAALAACFAFGWGRPTGAIDLRHQITVDGVFVGSLGGRQIALEIEPDDRHRHGPAPSNPGAIALYGSYYFIDRGIGLPLVGTYAADMLELHESNRVALPTRAFVADSWNVSRRGENAFVGTQTRNGRMLHVAFRKIAEYGPYRYGDAPAYLATLEAGRLTRGPEHVVSKSLSYRTLTDKRYALTTLEFIRFPNRKKNHTNSTLIHLLRDLQRHAYYHLTLAQAVKTRIAPDDGLRSRITFVSDHALTLEIRGNVNCECSLPPQLTRTTIDFETGDAVDWIDAIEKPAVIGRFYDVFARSTQHAPCHTPKRLLIAPRMTYLERDIRFGIDVDGLEVTPYPEEMYGTCYSDVIVPTRVARPALMAKYRHLLQ